MYAVIFKARVASMDEQYAETAARMRQLALTEYGCREFLCCTEGDVEIAISYWDSPEQIRAWRENSEHQQAQARGREHWYLSYSVEVTEVQREYSHGYEL